MIARLGAWLCFFIAAAAVMVPVILLDPVAVPGDEVLGSWRVLVNLNVNAFHLWRADPFSQAICALTAQPTTAFQMVLMLVGTWLALRQHSPLFTRNPGLRWLSSAVPSLAVIASVGFDPFVIGALAWLPLLSMMLFALLNATRARAAAQVLPLWIFALFVSVQNSNSANQASLFTALFALLVARYFWEREAEGRPLSLRAGGAVLLVAAGPALWASFAAPAATLPSYPENSHVAPEDGTGLLYHALVGPAYSLLTLDRPATASLYLPVSVLLLGLSLALLATTRRAGSEGRIRLPLFASAAALCLALDCALPHDWSLIAPLATISRLMPWGTVVSITSLAVGLVAWLVAVAAVSHTSRAVTLFTCMTQLLGALIAPPELWAPILAKHLTSSASTEAQRVIKSPSTSVVRNFLLQDPKFLERVPYYREQSARRMYDLFRLGGTYTLEPSVSRNDPNRPGGRPRLSTGRAGQLGNELCTATMPKDETLTGIEVSPGKNWGDFPRSIEISAGSCTKTDARPIVTIPQWQGPLLFTSEGMPYWGRHHEVRIVFPEPVNAQCVFIRQKGAARFDWAVDQIKILDLFERQP